MPSARFAGVPSPRTKPTFRTERFGLWESNVRVTLAEGNSPVLSGVDASGNPLRHFSTNGNAYWRLDLNSADETAMSWDKEDYFGLKFYIRPRTVAGRIQVWRKGDAGRGGPFFDIVDGKGRFGWWDNDQKREVYVETSAQVFWPGRVHYVYIRKQWPQQNTTDGNWEDGYWSNSRIVRINTAIDVTATVGGTVTDGTRTGYVIRQASARKVDVYTVAGAPGSWVSPVSGAGIPAATAATFTYPAADVFMVKRFQEFADGINDRTGYIAWTNSGANDVHTCGITSADATKIPGVDAVGVASPPGALFYGAVNGVVNAAAGTYTFRNEMVGMLWTWGSDAPTALIGKTYRIVSVSSTTSIITSPLYDTSARDDFSAIVIGSPIKGLVSTGVELIKSSGFDDSKAPDSSGSTIYFMGSEDQGKATSTYQPFDGETWCPGWTVYEPAVAGVDAFVFDATVNTDKTLTGSDYFNQAVWEAANTALHHQLQFEASNTRFCWDGRDYGAVDVVESTQPESIPLDSSDITGPTITRASGTVTPLGASKPFWEYVQGRSTWAGQRYVAVGFRDPVQGVSGRPSPVARIKALEDDTTNPSGVVRLLVSDLPVGPPGVEVVIYQSAADGDASVLFEAARVPNGTSEVAVEMLEALLALNQAADFDAYEPPRCGVVGAGLGRLVYGALEVQPNGLTPSRVGQPGLADFGKTFRLEGGSGVQITALQELDGLLAVFKRRAMGSVSFTTEGFAVVQLVSSGVGCVSPQALQAKDSLLWFVSDRGVQVSQRTGVTNLGKPEYVGENVERFFTNVVDLRRLPRCSAAINRTRNQFVVALRTVDEKRTNARISAELSGQDIAFSRYLGPNVTALATVQARESGADLVVGGTEEGFMVWMDREDTPLLLLGPDPLSWGAYQVQSYGGVYASTLALNARTVGTVDTDLAGPMGVTLRFNDAAGVERMVSVLGSDGTTMLFAEPLLAAIPEDTQVMVGAPNVRWETPWLDMGNSERMKSLIHVDLVFETRDQTPSGGIYCAIYRDWDMDNVRFETTLDLGDVPYRLTPTSLRGRWFKLVIEHAPNTPGVLFDVAALVWRVRDEDQV